MIAKPLLVARLGVLSFYAICGAAAAYELNTHEQITRYAFAKAVISSDALLVRLGAPSTVNGKLFPNSSGYDKTAQAVLIQGAVAEDDIPRFVNHFFNPWTGSGSGGFAAPEWGLAESPLVFPQRWSYQNARASLYLALTSPTQAERDRNFGATFESLGHVVHLLQDMAQPQHVRSDLHFSLLTKTHSRYEFWVERHLYDRALFGALDYPTAYSSTSKQLSTPRSFFNTGGTADVASGKGIAEFTARNFVSSGTNFVGTLANPVHDPLFPQPDGPFIRGFLVKPSLDHPPIPAEAVIEFLGTNVTDTLFPEYSGSNSRTTSFSIFDQDLAIANKAEVFALNEYNFLAAAHDFLLPRAVAYSAGFLDYFFRGDIDLRPDPAHTGKYVITNNSTEAMRGEVALYYDTADGTRKRVPGADWSDMLIPAKDAQTGAAGLSPFFSLQQPADIGRPHKYLVVFRGDMGDELRGNQLTNAAQGAVVGQVVNAAPLEALYVAGLDAGGQLITLRVDETGTHLLSGPDATGAVRSTLDFDPLRSLGASGTLNQRGYYIKQARFLDAGATQYRVQAFSGPGGAFARDTFNDSVTVGVAPGWVARSPDPTIGAFYFMPNVTGPNSGSLAYTRTYLDAQGEVAITSGVLRLPPLPNYDVKVGATGYDAFNWNTKLVLSETGLQVRGLRTATRAQSPNVEWSDSTAYPRTITTTQYEISLLISLAAVPSVTTSIDAITTSVQGWDRTWSGSASETLIGGNGCSNPSGPLKNDVADIVETSWVSGKDKLWVSQLRDGVHVIDVDQNDSTRTHKSHDYHYDASGGTDCIWTVAYTYNDHQDSATSLSTTYLLRDGGTSSTEIYSRATDNSIDPLPRVWQYDCRLIGSPSFCRVSGIGSIPVVKDTGPLDNDRRASIVLAFTATSDGVVWKHRPAPERTRFRGVDVTGKSFVGDASPLGEVFFATSDMSLVIHDVKNGRMPTFVPPPNMTSIVAAVWL